LFEGRHVKESSFFLLPFWLMKKSTEVLRKPSSKSSLGYNKPSSEHKMYVPAIFREFFVKKEFDLRTYKMSSEKML
jgi:hypothetical protein